MIILTFWQILIEDFGYFPRPRENDLYARPIPGQGKSPEEPFGAATADNGGNFADFSAFEVNIVYSCCIANGLKPDNKSQILSLRLQISMYQV